MDSTSLSHWDQKRFSPKVLIHCAGYLLSMTSFFERKLHAPLSRRIGHSKTLLLSRQRGPALYERNKQTGQLSYLHPKRTKLKNRGQGHALRSPTSICIPSPPAKVPQVERLWWIPSQYRTLSTPPCAVQLPTVSAFSPDVTLYRNKAVTHSPSFFRPLTIPYSQSFCHVLPFKFTSGIFFCRCTILNQHGNDVLRLIFLHHPNSHSDSTIPDL